MRGQHKAFALGRLKAGQMNQTEKAYAALLDARRYAGEVAWFKFEGIKLRLADNTFYTPDFAVMLADGSMQLHEVKGFMHDDANVKIKVAADMYPFEFILVRKKSKREGGGFIFIDV
jgi:rhamnogalacturonyl hydrolase YesR